MGKSPVFWGSRIFAEMKKIQQSIKPTDEKVWLYVRHLG